MDPNEDDDKVLEIEPQSSRSIEQAPAPTNLWTPMKMMTLYLRLSGSARLKVDRMLVINLPDISSTPGLARDEDPDPVIFGPPDPVLFSTDPDPDPTCNNGFIKLFLS